MIKLIIDGVAVEVEKGTSILDAARSVNITIPTLCHDDRLKPSGACRICGVEIEGSSELQASCTTPAREGMVVRTQSDRVRASRKQLLELIWEDHPNECLSCQKAGECDLQDLCYDYGVEAEGFAPLKVRTPLEESNPFYTFDKDKCILCGKCVRVCEELQGESAIHFVQRGHETAISHPFEKGMAYSTCVSCGNCVEVCPTAALMPKTEEKFRVWDIDKKVRTTCSYCGVGCQLDLVVKDNKVVRVDAAREGENEGMLCVKGKFGYSFLSHEDRLTTPLIREGEGFREASWDEALDLVADRMTGIYKAHGSEAFAAFASARCTNEDNYVLQKMVRGIFKTNNIDHCARL
jgi:formate dehydrogenase major subunit